MEERDDYREEFEKNFPQIFREIFEKSLDEQKPQTFRTDLDEWIYGENELEFEVIGRARVLYKIFPDGTVEKGFGKMQKGSVKKDNFVVRRGEKRWKDF